MKILVLGDHNYGTPWRALYPEADIDYVDTHQEVVPIRIYEYDAIQFTGGADVSPALYGQANTDARGTCAHRDLWEASIFASAVNHEVPMFGICRGSQFLRVMCGGALIQHIDGHGRMGTHEAVLSYRDAGSTGHSQLVLDITSTHHQASDGGQGWAMFTNFLLSETDGHIEGWSHIENNVHAVQYHPEYMDKDSDGFQLYLDVIRYGMGDKPLRWNINL